MLLKKPTKGVVRTFKLFLLFIIPFTVQCSGLPVFYTCSGTGQRDRMCSTVWSWRWNFLPNEISIYNILRSFWFWLRGWVFCLIGLGVFWSGFFFFFMTADTKVIGIKWQYSYFSSAEEQKVFATFPINFLHFGKKKGLGFWESDAPLMCVRTSSHDAGSKQRGKTRLPEWSRNSNRTKIVASALFPSYSKRKKWSEVIFILSSPLIKAIFLWLE